MREAMAIPRDELFEFKRRNGLSGSKMASHFDVNKRTMNGWLYRRNLRNMSRASYDIVMRKLAEADISLSQSEVLPPMDVILPSIASAIKGDAENCWLHYASEVYPHDPIKEKQVIIAYMRVEESTLKRWLNLMMPDGQNLLRLRCFLGHRGYGVVELEKLNGLLRALVYLIADRKITFTEAFSTLGYKHAGALIQVLLGSVKMSNERLDICRNLIAQYQAGKTVQEETLARGDDVEIKRVEEAPVLVQFNTEEAQSPIRRINGACRWEVENLAALVRIMLPLAEDVLSDAYTEKDRERLRTLTNGNEVFRLSNVLNGLCGPRVRVRIMNKQEGE